MSVSYFVRYDSAAPDLQAFLERNRAVHLPLDWRSGWLDGNEEQA